MILLEIDNEEGAKYIMWWHTAEGLKHTSRNCAGSWGYVCSVGL